MDFSAEWFSAALAATGDDQPASLGKSAWEDIFDAKCKDELQPMSTFNAILGLALYIISSLSIVPSLTKPYNRRSTAGMSPATLLLTNFQQTFQVANMICLKWEQVGKCRGDIIGCQPSLISFYSAFTAWALLFLQYLCTVWFPEPPEAGKMNRMLWYVQLGSCGLVILVCLTWVSIHRCSEDDVLRYTGIVFGLISSVLMMFRFAPQLYESCKLRSAGSISYITYAVIGVGGFISTYFSAFASKDPWSSWFPVFVGNCMQTIILATCLYFDWVRPAVESVVHRASLSFNGGSQRGSRGGSQAAVEEQRELAASMTMEDQPEGAAGAGDKAAVRLG